MKYANFVTTFSAQSISANASYDVWLNIAKDGYEPVALAGWSADGTGSSFALQNTVALDGDSQAHIRVRNVGSSAASPTFSVNVLYRKIS